MSRYHSYLNSAVSILSSYKGEEPFAAYSRKFFAANKKYGSADRRMISHLCYCSFRTSGLFGNESPEERILKGLFLCADQPSPLLEQLKPAWNAAVALPPEEKLEMLSVTGNLADLFPFPDELSDDIDVNGFAASLLVQPDLFLRVRPGQKTAILRKLEQARLPFHELDEMSLALPNGSKVEPVLALDKEAVVQDLSSQRVGEFMQLVRKAMAGTLQVWDCCAASGGKSIMAYDIDPTIQLTVSDVRESIMTNLTKRFERSGISKYRSFIADLVTANIQSPIPNDQYSMIIADLPCSGSGTWGRTPEQLAFFDQGEIRKYAERQKAIIGNVGQQLQPGGYLLYITCSVFKRENEDNVAYCMKTQGYQLVKMELLKGYDKKADTLFAALLQKPL